MSKHVDNLKSLMRNEMSRTKVSGREAEGESFVRTVSQQPPWAHSTDLEGLQELKPYPVPCCVDSVSLQVENTEA